MKLKDILCEAKDYDVYIDDHNTLNVDNLQEVNLSRNFSDYVYNDFVVKGNFQVGDIEDEFELTVNVKIHLSEYPDHPYDLQFMGNQVTSAKFIENGEVSGKPSQRLLQTIGGMDNLRRQLNASLNDYQDSLEEQFRNLLDKFRQKKH